MILISSSGANRKSNIFYSHVKSLLELSPEIIWFEEFNIPRPSLVLGKRNDTLSAEYISKLIMDHLYFLIPWKYKPIHESINARTKSSV